MQIDRILYPITTLGPSKRVVIWTIGCKKHCFNCANPELWEANPHKNIQVDRLAKMLNDLSVKENIKSITFTGGDPLEQKEELHELLTKIRFLYDDILVYTGFTYEEVDAKYLENIDVLIDGKYIEKENINDLSLRGSKNQRIFYLNSALKNKYEEYLIKGRQIQNIYYDGKLISIGIHNILGKEDL